MAGLENITIGTGNMTNISNMTENAVNTSDSLDDLNIEDIVFGTIGILAGILYVLHGSSGHC